MIRPQSAKSNFFRQLFLSSPTPARRSLPFAITLTCRMGLTAGCLKSALMAGLRLRTLLQQVARLPAAVTTERSAVAVAIPLLGARRGPVILAGLSPRR